MGARVYQGSRREYQTDDFGFFGGPCSTHPYLELVLSTRNCIAQSSIRGSICVLTYLPSPHALILHSGHLPLHLDQTQLPQQAARVDRPLPAGTHEVAGSHPAGPLQWQHGPAGGLAAHAQDRQQLVVQHHLPRCHSEHSTAQCRPRWIQDLPGHGEGENWVGL